MAAHWVALRDAADRRPLAAELRRVNDALLEASGGEPPDTSRIFDLHTRFHQCCVDACGGARVRAMHGSVKPQAERYRRLYSTAQGPHIQASLAEHEVIIRAIANGDADAAEGAVKANWRNAAVRLARVIEKAGERGSW